MAASDARIAANRANSALSTGPKTEAGKAASRANSYKHGMTGLGVVLSDADAARVEATVREIGDELKPSCAIGRALAKRVAILAVRMERCVAHDSAALADRVRKALTDFQAPGGGGRGGRRAAPAGGGRAGAVRPVAGGGPGSPVRGGGRARLFPFAQGVAAPEVRPGGGLRRRGGRPGAGLGLAVGFVFRGRLPRHAPRPPAGPDPPAGPLAARPDPSARGLAGLGPVPGRRRGHPDHRRPAPLSGFGGR